MQHPSNLNYGKSDVWSGGDNLRISGLPGIFTRTLPPLLPEIRLGHGGGDLDVTADIKPKAERISLNTSERGGGEWAGEEGGGVL